MNENQYLLIRRPGAEPERFALDPSAPCTLGRSQSNTVPLGDASISRNHAQIFFRDGAFWIEDLGSKNGTFLRGQKLEAPSELSDGDVIAVGPVVLKFRAARATVSTATDVGD